MKKINKTGPSTDPLGNTASYRPPTRLSADFMQSIYFIFYIFILYLFYIYIFYADLMRKPHMEETKFYFQ